MESLGCVGFRKVNEAILCCCPNPDCGNDEIPSTTFLLCKEVVEIFERRFAIFGENVVVTELVV